MGVVLMESGHAYRITHHQHHTMFPEEEDPEGYPAKISLLGAILYGPVFLVRLWLWAFKRRPDQRLWLAYTGRGCNRLSKVRSRFRLSVLK